MFNSTIQVKRGECCDCNDGKEKPLIAGRCNNHYSTYRKILSQKRISAREADKVGLTLEEKAVKDLKKECDILISRFIRLSNADENGLVECFTCGNKNSWKTTQAGHYISREDSLLRFDLDRNLRPQCIKCNVHMDGNISQYTKRLERDMPGVTEILLEEANIVYKFTRDELRQLIYEYSQKVDALMAKRK